METLEIQKNILYGLQDLPTDKLQEVLDFVFFLRNKMLYPEIFEREMQVLNESKEEIPEALGLFLEERLAKYEANPESASSWEEVQERLHKKYNWA